MDTISIRYGEDVTLPINAGSDDYVTAAIYVGKPGEVYVLTKSISLTDGEGVFLLSDTDTALPLDTYNYQINLTDGDGNVIKLPSPNTSCTDCDGEFPQFIVCEALDVTEVS